MSYHSLVVNVLLALAVDKPHGSPLPAQTPALFRGDRTFEFITPHPACQVGVALVRHTFRVHSPAPTTSTRPSGRNTILAFSIRFVKPASSFLCLSFVSPLCDSHHISDYQRPTRCPASTGPTLFARAKNARIKARCSFVKSTLAVVGPSIFRSGTSVHSIASLPSCQILQPVVAFRFLSLAGHGWLGDYGSISPNQCSRRAVNPRKMGIKSRQLR